MKLTTIFFLLLLLYIVALYRSDLRLRKLITRYYTLYPFLGSRHMEKKEKEMIQKHLRQMRYILWAFITIIVVSLCILIISAAFN